MPAAEVKVPSIPSPLQRLLTFPGGPGHPCCSTNYSVFVSAAFNTFSPCALDRILPTKCRLLALTEVPCHRERLQCVSGGLPCGLGLGAQGTFGCAALPSSQLRYGDVTFRGAISSLFGPGLSTIPAAAVTVPSIPSPLQGHVKHSCRCYSSSAQPDPLSRWPWAGGWASWMEWLGDAGDVRLRVLRSRRFPFEGVGAAGT